MLARKAGVMPSGGARLRSGPPPDPNALRREKKSDGEWMILPSEGPQGDAPVWPLTEASDREAVIWERLWQMPQAHIWLQRRQHDQVALYVRRFVEAEEPGAAVGRSTLVRQLADNLLLSIPAMLSARVQIAEDEVAKRRTSKSAKAEDGGVRGRLEALDGGA